MKRKYLDETFLRDVEEYQIEKIETPEEYIVFKYFLKVKEKYGQNCRLPSAQVPMVEVVNFYNININYLKKVSQINDK